jgi:molecular chaperone GrpE
MSDTQNPLEDVENEIYLLLKKCGLLESQLKESFLKHSSEIKRLFLSIIEINDAFENIFRTIDPKSENLDGIGTGIIKNFKTIQKLLIRMLKSYDVVSFDTYAGQKAIPDKHFISEITINPDMEDETIIEEIKKGYLWKGDLLRAAEVKVTKNS